MKEAELVREVQLTDWLTAGNLFNRFSRVQKQRDICTRFGGYLYSANCSWIFHIFPGFSLGRFGHVQSLDQSRASKIFDGL